MNKQVMVIALLGLFFFTGCVTIYNPATERKEIYFVSEESEITMGRNMVEDIIGKEEIVQDEELNNYLNEIGQRIAKASHRNSLKHEFRIIDQKELNAFALPGGFVFVNKGLIDKVDEDELAFVLGHEIGHIAARHSVKRLQSSLGISLLLGIGLQGADYQNVARGISTMYNVVALGYSRKDELLADSLAVKYTSKAGYSPEAGLSLLKKLEQEGKTRTFVFLSSHPTPTQRSQNIEKELKSLQVDN